jgi:hypothetical protein
MLAAPTASLDDDVRADLRAALLERFAQERQAGRLLSAADTDVRHGLSRLRRLMADSRR